MARPATTQPGKTGGDDLDDGLELDPDLLAASDEEGGAGSVVDDEEIDRESGDLEDDNGDADQEVAEQGRKRKTEEGDDPAAAEKKRRKKEKEKERKARRGPGSDPQSSPAAPTHLKSSELSALLLRSIRETLPVATAMELDDIMLPDDRLLPPPDYPCPINPIDPFEPLVKRLESLLAPLQNKKLKASTPRVIILSLSGLRCADVVRGVRGVKGQGEVAKLFAKHFKLEEQVKYLARTKISIAVGTPGRVGKLLAEDAIRISSDTVLLLDIGHRDSKTRTLLTLPEVRTELWKTVFSGKAREVLFAGGARIGAF